MNARELCEALDEHLSKSLIAFYAEHAELSLEVVYTVLLNMAAGTSQAGTRKAPFDELVGRLQVCYEVAKHARPVDRLPGLGPPRAGADAPAKPK